MSNMANSDSSVGNMFHAMKHIMASLGKRILSPNANNENSEREAQEEKEDNEIKKLLEENDFDCRQLNSFSKEIALEKRENLKKEKERAEKFAVRRNELEGKHIWIELQEKRKIKLYEIELKMLEDERLEWEERQRQRAGRIDHLQKKLEEELRLKNLREQTPKHQPEVLHNHPTTQAPKQSSTCQPKLQPLSQYTEGASSIDTQETKVS